MQPNLVSVNRLVFHQTLNLFKFQIKLFLDTNDINDLIRLHIRLNTIKNEIEILENPEMRQVFEENINSHLNRNGLNSKRSCKSFLISLPGSIAEQIKNLDSLKQLIKADEPIEIYRSLKVINIIQSYIKYINHFYKIIGMLK